eukprot:2123569-Alexandrium_andersonii.AAC.1
MFVSSGRRRNAVDCRHARGQLLVNSAPERFRFYAVSAFERVWDLLRRHRHLSVYMICSARG